MKRLIFAIGVLAAAYAASTPARADFAVARFQDHWCRVWVDAAAHPFAAHYVHWIRREWVHHVWWSHHRRHHSRHLVWVRYDRFRTFDAADHHLHLALHEHRCRP